MQLEGQQRSDNIKEHGKAYKKQKREDHGHKLSQFQ